MTSLAETVPLSKTMSEDLGRLPDAVPQGRARPASGRAAATLTEVRRKIEL